MSMDFIREGKNGQMEIDFQSLEAITSFEFVDEIKFQAYFGESMTVENVKVEVEEGYYVRVYLTRNFVCTGNVYEYYIFTFYYENKSYTVNRFTPRQIETFKNMGVI